MIKTKFNTLAPVRWDRVQFRSGFWGQRVAGNIARLIPAIEQQCEQTGRFDAMKLDWQAGMPNQPQLFWDSDVAKWLEAACRTLTVTHDAALRNRIDEVVDLIIGAQQHDGYLNSYFTVMEPDQRWKNLRDGHELYCAGHLVEAAVAHYQATGERRLLDAMCRFADLIATVFGPEPGQQRGYPGHEEIELALVMLYRVTDESRYLELARFFIEERGRQPHYYDMEKPPQASQNHWSADAEPYEYYQAHRPVREQDTLDGHAVRALYLLAGMVDLAVETDDESLMTVCRKLWHNATRRRMYVTGGVGSSAIGERFTVDYDLPEEEAYAETCAAIALVFAGHRMLQADPDSDYADVVELALFNAIAAGVSVAGDRFFYANPLAMHPPSLRFQQGPYAASRQPFFECACCPPNVARLFADLGRYVYSTSSDTVYVHLYADGQADIDLDGQLLSLEQNTRYPWDGRIQLCVQSAGPITATVALRIPGWCDAPQLTVNHESIVIRDIATKGYAFIQRTWQPGDVITLDLPMAAHFVEAHPHCRQAAGKLALRRGPIVYCFEQADNGDNLGALFINGDSDIQVRDEPELFGGATSLHVQGDRRLDNNCPDTLYRKANSSAYEAVELTAIPYALWGNREPGEEMRVWLSRR